MALRRFRRRVSSSRFPAHILCQRDIANNSSRLIASSFPSKVRARRERFVMRSSIPKVSEKSAPCPVTGRIGNIERRRIGRKDPAAGRVPDLRHIALSGRNSSQISSDLSPGKISSHCRPFNPARHHGVIDRADIPVSVAIDDVERQHALLLQRGAPLGHVRRLIHRQPLIQRAQSARIECAQSRKANGVMPRRRREDGPVF